ncbi:MAG: zeta toxin family protein, partial [Candidatus Omnitrophota bacterium]|nr:zeta toxin family protein [Candidatus Omnitrophota bacterium]
GPKVMGLYQGGVFTSAENRPFFRAFMAKAVASSERGAISRDGQLSKEGDDRLSAAVLAAAYDDAALLSRMLESTDDNIRNVTGAMRDAAGAFIRLKEAVRSGDASEQFDITPQLAEAARTVADLRERGIKPAEFLAQTDAFNQVDPAVEELLRTFYNGDLSRALSREKLTEVLTHYAEEAAKHRANGLIPDETKPRDIFKASHRSTQANLFASGESDAGRGDAGRGAEAQGSETGRGGPEAGQRAQAGEVNPRRKKGGPLYAIGYRDTVDRVKAKYMGLGFPGESAIAGEATWHRARLRSGHRYENLIAHFGGDIDGPVPVGEVWAQDGGWAAAPMMGPTTGGLRIFPTRAAAKKALDVAYENYRKDWQERNPLGQERGVRTGVDLKRQFKVQRTPLDKEAERARVERYLHALDGKGRPPLSVIEGGNKKGMSLAAREAAARKVMQSPEWIAAGEPLKDPSLYTYNQEGYGSAAWQQAREYVGVDGETILGTPAATLYLADQAEASVSGGVAKDKQAFLVIGYPGAGKSTIAHSISQQFRAAHMVADLAKEIIPEYEGGKGGERVHQESADLGGMAAGELVSRGDNIILETLGATEEAVEGRANWLRRNGYTVALIHMDVPKAIAMERAVARFRRSGRSIPAHIYDTLNAQTTYDRARASGEIDETATVRWDEPSDQVRGQGQWRLEGAVGSLAALEDALPEGRPADRTRLGETGRLERALEPVGEPADRIGAGDIAGGMEGSRDEALSAFKPAFHQATPAFAKALKAELERALPPGAGVVVANKLLHDSGLRVHEMVTEPELSERAGFGARWMLQVAVSDVDSMRSYGRHGVVHILREMGLWTDKEWQVLVERTKKAGIQQQLEAETAYTTNSGKRVSTWEAYRELYAEYDRRREYLDQELVAVLAETWSGGANYGSRINALLRRIGQFLEAVRNALNGLGFHTADDIFERAFSGEIAATRTPSPESGYGDPLYALAMEQRRAFDQLGFYLTSIDVLTNPENPKYIKQEKG